MMGWLFRHPNADYASERLPRVAGVLLAAGSSRRMGKPKLALRWPDGRSVGSVSFRQLRMTLQKTIVVVRTDDSLGWLHDELVRMRAQPGGTDSCMIVRCAEAETEGMAASLRAGVLAASRLGADGALIALADQPFAGCRLMHKLVHAFQASGGADWAAASDTDGAKPPVVLSSSLFPRVQQLSGDEGARKLLKDPFSRGVLVQAEPGCFMDIDTPDDWLRAERMRAGLDSGF
ncbi:nucleotidyltransferase family protein [Paenibacillus kobensis]|uniref:nucleotidyltransferase family protein n=1 Tax=Paenibacillus kobensis TaxID=59841 RepID=UPI000FD8A4A2|nr:nucleotidyltransferase family protein [Paenibacillus kobensis]